MMKALGSFALAGVLAVSLAGAAAARSDRADEMAECGYLLGLAAEQVHAANDRPELLQALAGEVSDFTKLYYHHAGKAQNPEQTGITLQMYNVVMAHGRQIFGRRITAMSETGANRLANALANSCRQDLWLLGKKLGH